MTESSQFSDSREYQIKVLSYMANNHDFCEVARAALKDEFFSDKALQWFFDTMAKAEIKLTPATLKHELLQAAKNKTIRKDDVPKYVEYYNFLKVAPLPVEVEYINKDLSKFIRTQSVKKALFESWDLAESERWDEIVESMQEAVRTGLDVLDTGYWFFDKAQDRINNRLVKPEGEKLPTGIPDLDSILYGGIKPKQLALAVGGTGRGKTNFLCWLAQTALIMNKKVVYFTFELSEEDIAERFDALLTQINIAELSLYNQEVMDGLAKLSGRFGNNLVIKEYPADGASVNVLKAFLNNLAGIGFVPDLVLVDYLDLVEPHRNYNSAHEELDSITKALHGLSKSFNTRIWTATQLNRTGLGMDTPDETTIAGAVAKLFTVDVAIFIAQTTEEREAEELRLVVPKNRNGPAGRAVCIGTDYAKMTFFRPRTLPVIQPPIQEEEICDRTIEEELIDELSGASAEDDMLVLS